LTHTYPAGHKEKYMKGLKKYLGVAVLSACCAQAWAVPTLTVTSSPTVAPGSSVGVDVAISDIADLYIYQFSLAFDANVLHVSSYSLGSFLDGAVDTFGDAGTLDNSAGTISYVFNTLVGPESGVSGSGSLLHVTFDALAAGASAINFSDLLLLDSSGNDIAATVVNGSVNVETPPAGDVPEPASWMLVGAGLAAAAALRRRRVDVQAAHA
jgi:hypothetical protein